MDNIAFLSEKQFVLGVGEIKEIKIDIFASSEAKPGVYIGKLIVRGGKIQKPSTIIVEIKEKSALFDIRISIPKEYKRLNPGDELVANMTLRNIGFKGTPLDVELYMSILDLDKNNIYETSKEIIGVEDVLEIEGKLKIPENILPGKYILLMQVSYNDITIDSFDLFDLSEIQSPEKKRSPELDFLLVILSLIILLGLSLVDRLIKHRKVKKKKVIKQKKGWHKLRKHIRKGGRNKKR